MAVNGHVTCRPGYGKASHFVALPEPNDALVVVILRPGHQDDQVLRDHPTLASLLAVADNKECTAPGYGRGIITVGATETYDDVNNRVDSTLDNYTFPRLGAMSGTGAKQDQAAVLLCYQRNRTGSSDQNTLPLIKFHYPFVADGSDRMIPLSQGFLRATGQA